MVKTAHQTVRVSQPEPHILKLEMNRPEAANAFNTLKSASELVLELFEASGYGV